MDFSNEYPEYRAVAQHIRRAHAEHSVYLAHRIVAAMIAAMRFVKGLASPRRSQIREA
jgi:hypothetical protein